MLPFQKLDAWRLSHEFALAIREETKSWPREERFGLTEQLRRAALSIPTNIAEGQAKRGSRELRRFLDIGLGSFSEVTYLLLFARDCGLLPPGRWATLEPMRRRVGLVLWHLYRGVSRHSETP
jgi:four helix bundle protein